MCVCLVFLFLGGTSWLLTRTTPRQSNSTGTGRQTATLDGHTFAPCDTTNLWGELRGKIRAALLWSWGPEGTWGPELEHFIWRSSTPLPVRSREGIRFWVITAMPRSINGWLVVDSWSMNGWLMVVNLFITRCFTSRSSKEHFDDADLLSSSRTPFWWRLGLIASFSGVVILVVKQLHVRYKTIIKPL